MKHILFTLLVSVSVMSPAPAMEESPRLSIKQQQPATLPEGLLDQIITHLSQGRDAKELISFLTENQVVNGDLFHAPLDLKLSPYSEVITDEIIAGLITLFPFINSLDLSGCQKITETTLANLQKLQNLTSLNLKFTKTTDNGLARLSNLQNLTELNVAFNNKITDEGLSYLQPLQKLTSLNLDKTAITDAGLLTTVMNLTNLTDLSVRGIKFFNKLNIIRCVENLKKLTHLYVDSYHFTIYDLRRLESDKPTLKINKR